MQEERRQFRSVGGEDKVSKAVVYIGAAVDFNPDTDDLTLPSGFDPQNPKVQAVFRYSDGVAAHHTELFL